MGKLIILITSILSANFFFSSLLFVVGANSKNKKTTVNHQLGRYCFGCLERQFPEAFSIKYGLDEDGPAKLAKRFVTVLAHLRRLTNLSRFQTACNMLTAYEQRKLQSLVNIVQEERENSSPLTSPRSPRESPASHSSQPRVLKVTVSNTSQANCY